MSEVCSIITSRNINGHFYEALSLAAHNQKLAASEASLSYLVNLLSMFLRSEALFVETPDGKHIQALALVYADAVHAKKESIRQKCLRRLGDVSLFISGMFSNSLRRKPVDVDYYIAMGGAAYSYLADNPKAEHLDTGVFDELSNKFSQFVDLLMEVSASSGLTNSIELMRVYDLWIKTKSPYLAQQLRKHGIHPLTQEQTLH